MSERTDWAAGHSEPSALTAFVKICRMSPLGVDLAMSRKMSVFCSGLADEDFTLVSLHTRKL
jgi:hypothetical protein